MVDYGIMHFMVLSYRYQAGTLVLSIPMPAFQAVQR